MLNLFKRLPFTDHYISILPRVYSIPIYKSMLPSKRSIYDKGPNLS